MTTTVTTRMTTTMTTRMITTGTTMMTDVVVAPSLRELLVGCVLLLTETVPLVVICSLRWGEEDTPTVCKVVGVDAVERKTQDVISLG